MGKEFIIGQICRLKNDWRLARKRFKIRGLEQEPKLSRTYFKSFTKHRANYEKRPLSKPDFNPQRLLPGV